jgi:hypothetical protein
LKLTKEQLSSLSRDEKLKLLELVEEKKRREFEARTPFVPHAGQLRILKSKARERYLFCGNGFGKSTILVNEVHWAATGFNPLTEEHTPVPAKIFLVLDTPEKIEDFIEEYRNWNPLPDSQLHKRGKANYSAITWPNGSTLTVFTHEVGDLKAEGSQWTHGFFDEPPPRSLYISLYRGGRKKGRPIKILLAGTPVKAAWLRTDVFEPWKEGLLPWAECFEGDTDENLDNLDRDWYESFFAKLDDKEKAIRKTGQFYDLGGLALAHLYSPKSHLVSAASKPWNPDNPCVIVMDPHPSKAHVAVLLGVDEFNYLYVIDEYKEKALARPFMQSLIDKGWFHNRIIDVLYDSLGSGETTSGEGFKPFGVVVNEVLRENGLGRARATSYDEKSDEDFIERIRDALMVPLKADDFGLKLPKLRFYEHCRGSITDIKTVQWYEDKQVKENKPKLDTRKKDFLSCIKYGLATNLYHKKKKDKAYHVSRPMYGISRRSMGLGARVKIRG